MTKYRLKKDTPFYKKGTEFYEDWNCKGVLLNDSYIVVGSLNGLDNPDEWFEEVKEPTWVRKQIERVDITAGYKYTEIQYRFIKPFYYDDAEWGVDVYAKNDTSYQRFYMYDTPDKSTYLNKVAFINQLVRDGYIEIQDNPNIVWEDEKCD